jgi:RimJ/RimL family protein N-acetyltransferase
MTAMTVRPVTDKAFIHTQRRKYINSLIAFQELYLELQVRVGTFYQIEMDDDITGYCIVSKDGAGLVEFYSIYSDLFKNLEILKRLFEHLGIKRVYCKSFDLPLLNVLFVLNLKASVEGILFRRYRNKLLKSEDENSLSETIASTADHRRIMDMGSDFFESDSELDFYMKGRNVILFEDSGKRLLGCGLYQRIIDDYCYFDIGMVVNPDYRRMGYGTCIIKHMIAICEREAVIPICGCDYKNIASRQTLIKAGFIPEYELIKFDL